MQILDQIISILGVEYGEVFSCRGSNHVAHHYHGTEENFVFTEYALHKSVFPADMNRAITSGDIRFLPLAESDFHAIVTGMLKIVKTPGAKRKYLLSYNPNRDTVLEEAYTKAYQSTLF